MSDNINCEPSTLHNDTHTHAVLLLLLLLLLLFLLYSDFTPTLPMPLTIGEQCI